MNIKHFNQKKPSNVLPLKKNLKRLSAKQRSHDRNSKNQTVETLEGFLNVPLRLLRITTILLFFVTSSLFQFLLRIAYGGLLTIGLVLFAIAGILALFAGGKTPANLWPSVWHGESVLLLLALGGFLLDVVLIILQITIGATQAKRPHRA